MFLVKSNISPENAASSHNKYLCQESILTRGAFQSKLTWGTGAVCSICVNLRQGSSRALVTVGQPKCSPVGWRTDSGGSELQGQAGPGAGGSAEAWPWPEDGHQREGHCQTWDILTFQQWQEEKGLPFPHPDVGTEPRHLCHGSERCFSCSGLQPEAHIPLQRPPLQGTAQTTGNPNPPAWECHSFSTKPLFSGTSEL